MKYEEWGKECLVLAEKEYTDCNVRPKQREKQVECFSKDEQRKIEQYIYEKKKTKLFGILLCLYTGLIVDFFVVRVVVVEITHRRFIVFDFFEFGRSKTRLFFEINV